MEMNLYGVASINLDNIRGREIRKRVIIAVVFYLIAVILCSFIPQRLVHNVLGKSEEIGIG